MNNNPYEVVDKFGMQVFKGSRKACHNYRKARSRQGENLKVKPNYEPWTLEQD